MQPDDPVADPSSREDAAPPPPPPGAAADPYPHDAYPHRNWRHRRNGIFDPQRKSAGLACFLSAMPGLGQIYLGSYQRGFVHLFVIAAAMALAAEDAIPLLTPLLVMFIVFFWLYNMIDAGRRAALYNRALQGGQEIDLPPDLIVTGTSGTLFGGLGLVAVGVIILLYNLDFSMEWLEEWWPVAPIAFGLYLIVKALWDRTKQA